MDKGMETSLIKSQGKRESRVDGKIGPHKYSEEKENQRKKHRRSYAANRFFLIYLFGPRAADSCHVNHMIVGPWSNMESCWTYQSEFVGGWCPGVMCDPRSQTTVGSNFIWNSL